MTRAHEPQVVAGVPRLDKFRKATEPVPVRVKYLLCCLWVSPFRVCRFRQLLSGLDPQQVEETGQECGSQ